MIYGVLEILSNYKVYKDMSDNTINMEKAPTRTTKEIQVDIENVTSEQTINNRNLKVLCKELEKAIKIELKEASKRKTKSKDSDTKRDPSGFNAPQPIPIEFCEEPWNYNTDEVIPRTKLTKEVYDYIKKNNLQDPEDKRKIFADDVIKKLFHLKDSDELHFNNFQAFMKRLYIRNFDENNNDDSSIGSISESDADASDISDVEIQTTKGKTTKGKTKNVETVSIPNTTKKSNKKGKKSTSASQNL